MKLVRFLIRQRALALARAPWRALARCLLEDLLDCRDYELGVHFIAAAEMAGLNEKYLGHEGSTDIITFNHHESPGGNKLHGEIFICVDDALVHARRFGVRWPSELTRCVVHGVLHLQGYDDTNPASRRVMKRLENKLLKELSTRFALGKLGRRCR